MNRPIDTFVLQINGRNLFTMEGELRPPGDRFGPGGYFIITCAIPSAATNSPKVGDKVFLIALPDAPQTTQHNPARAEQEKQEKKER